MFWIGFLIGLVLGSLAVIFVMGCLVISSEHSREEERHESN